MSKPSRHSAPSVRPRRQERFTEYTRQALLESGRLTITVEECARFLCLSRGTAYACVRNGEIPSLALGHRRLVLVPALLRMLGEGQ